MDVTQLTTAQIDAMKQYGVRVVAGVETEPVTIEQARLQLKIVVDDSDEMSPFDAWITQIGLPAAREWWPKARPRPSTRGSRGPSPSTLPTNR